MKHKQYWMPAPLIIKLATLVALTLAFLASGCEVSKKFKENKSDTASVKKSAMAVENSGNGSTVRTEDNRTHEETDWFRLTMKYLTEKNNGDTTINNFITQPATVIYEGGKSTRNEDIKRVDSGWYQNTMKVMAMAVDSISRKVEDYEKNKSSKTKGLGLFVTFLIGIGLIIFYQTLSYIINRVKTNTR